ncbi:nucleoid occlusion protein [Loigolactobacillus backii]|uniref:Nucleoid occlusion protein n=1 Tax=Loigolactobacillus backii TaxID=375175 RepID=A0A192H184_9LACO|nr:nucleoid occlusion protein [Loigolactobacillus backii]ANK60459.1 nucleoid occlusion protein [Loigolactobacillus backii]ANK62043.1 nucleoid occlusion protein [Loigolactobacillus backii]ANK65337.1 nucleoid occlusion protein [Loigolactobacillus backii]ANK67889.1 nucleoid occlusion protein [Loigolactobacillus backii]ANK68763.1 nucleoid occlusion protein [Loigolactobacillus backii]
MALSSFFGNNHHKTEVTNKVVLIPTAQIVPNRFQPRQVFNAAKISELADTIRQHGLLQPIVLRKYHQDHYEIVAGERRFRAIAELGWEKVSAIVTPLDDQETASMALIENLQREELTVIEEARAYQKLMTLNELTQEALARRIGKSQSFVANKLRLLKLAQPVQDALLAQEITERHGRSLLSLNTRFQIKMLAKIKTEHLTVKQTDELIKTVLQTAKLPKQTGSTKQAKKPLTKRQTKSAIAAIRRSLQYYQDAGMAVKENEENLADVYRITIELPKK